MVPYLADEWLHTMTMVPHLIDMMVWRSLSWLIPHNVQFQQRDETVRELQGGSREVAFTKQLRCQLKVKSGRVFASLWPHNTEPILPSLSPNTPHNAYFQPPLCLLRNTKNGNLGYKKSQYTVYWIFFKSISFHGVVQTYDANPVIKENK